MAAALLAGAGRAQAMIVTQVWSGTGTAFESDQTFDWTATIKFNDDVGAKAQDDISEDVYGGTTESAADPTVSASILIDGINYNLLAPSQGAGYVALQGVYYDSEVVDAAGSALVLYGTTPDAAPNFNTPFSGTIGDTDDGSYFIPSDGSDGQISPRAYDETSEIGGYLHPASLQETVSAAPEPSAWALMIAGLGGIGLVLRQARRRMGTTATA